MGMDLNKKVRPQAELLTKIASVYSNERSMHEQPYPSEKQMSFRDILKLLFNAGKLVKVMSSINRSIKLIRQTSKQTKKLLSEKVFSELLILLQKHKVDSYGFAEIDGPSVFKEKGIPYNYALVIAINMDANEFVNAPSMDAQIEVIRIYGDTGTAVNEITEFLRNKGYNAAPNHSMGGNIDYCKAGMNAGLGYIGRHGMLITPENGACHRSAIVYTDIENLGNYIRSKQDHCWIAEYCSSCGKCIKKCPTKAILPKAHIDRYGNVTSIDYDKCCAGFKEYGCGVCIEVCPFTSIGYEALKTKHIQKRNKTLNKGKYETI